MMTSRGSVPGAWRVWVYTELLLRLEFGEDLHLVLPPLQLLVLQHLLGLLLLVRLPQ